MILFGGIIIKITSKDGTVTEIEVPEGSKIEIVNDGDKPAKPGKPAMPKPVATTPSAPASDPIDFAAERRAAESVLKVGGRVELESELGQPVALVDGKLPEGLFAVRIVDFNNVAAVTDADLEPLRGCRRVQSLFLNSTKINGSGLSHIAHLRTLTNLTLDGTPLTDAGLAHIAPLTQLRFLTLTFTMEVTDAGLVHLQNLTQLESLYLPYSVTDQGVQVLSRLNCLRECSAGAGHGVTDVGVAQMIAQNPDLEVLTINGGLRTLAPLAGMRRLRDVRISGGQLKPAGLHLLQALPELRSLTLYSGMNASDVTRLSELPQLRRVEIYNNHGGAPPNFGDEAFASLARLPLLEAISVHGNLASPTDAALQSWTAIPTLKIAFLSVAENDRQYTPAGIAKFRALRPDVHLAVDGKDYFPSSAIPYSVIQKLDETDPLPKWELPEGSPLPVVAPCKPEEATALQQKWAEHLQRPVVEELASPAGLGLKFALIPPGEFRKIFTRPRDPAIEPDMPVRRFRITKPYALSTTEVTWDQFRQFVEATGYQTEAETNGLGGRDRAFKQDPKITWRTPGWRPAPNEPVTQVTPRDAEAFCAWLTESARSDRIHAVDGKPAPNTKQPDDVKRPDKSGHYELYRLPTEAEWVHACRAGSVHKHVVGPEPGDLADYAWTKEFLDPNSQASPLHLVAQKKPNPFGLHDTLGNVWEYTRDSLSPTLMPYLETNNPFSGQSSSLLGVAWDGAANVTHPEWGYAGFTTPTMNVGFRVLKQFDGEPLPGPLDRPLVLRAGQPLSVHALVPRPEKIPGLQSWSIELAGPHAAGNSVSIAASPKGDLIATGSHYGKISLWDGDGNYQRALLGHEGWILSLDFSPDGRWLASCERTGGAQGTGGDTARVWNVETGALHAVIPIPGAECHRIKFSPNGEHLAVSILYGQSAFVVVNLATGGIRSVITRSGIGLAWSPDGTELACSHGDNRLRVWDAKTLRVLRDVDAQYSHSLEWSPDGQWLALRTSDGKVAIRDVKTLEVTQTFGSNVPGVSHALTWLPDSQRLVVAGAGSPSAVCNTMTGEQLAKFELSGTAFYGLALRANGTEVVGEASSRLHFYDTTTGQKLREGKERGATGFTFSMLSTDGREVVAQEGGKAYVSNAVTGERLRSFPVSDNAYEPKPSPDGKWIGLRQHYGLPILPLVDAQTGATRHELSHDKGNVTRVAWSPDGKWLATGATDKLVRVWNVASGKIEHELAGHTGTLWSPAWSPDGLRLASAAEDKTVRLWNPHAGKVVATYDQFPEAINPNNGLGNSLAWTSDSRRLWIALVGNIVPLDVETGTVGPMENFSNGNNVQFLNTSPNGQRLLAREGYDWTFVRGRDAQDRRQLGQYLGHTAQWHPDSRRFLGWQPFYGTVGFDVETNRRLGMLFPWLTGDHWLCLGPTGHYRGGGGQHDAPASGQAGKDGNHSLARRAGDGTVEDQFVYVAMLPDGSQRTYTPAEFAQKFNWKNDPEKAELLGKAEDLPPPKPAPAAPSTPSNTPTLPETKSSATIKKPMSKAVASLTPNKTPSITPPKTNSAEVLADVERPQALKVPVSATKVDIPATLPKPKSGQPVSVRQIVTKPASLKDLASWSIEPAGHLGEIHAVSWSPSGEFILTTGYQDDSLRLWRVEAGAKGPELRLHRVMLGEHGVLEDARFSPDGRTVAAASRYGHSVAFYDVATGRRLSEFSLKEGVARTLQWTSDGKQVLAASSPRIAMVDPIKGQVRTTEQATNYVGGALSPDERWIVTTEELGKLRWFDSINLKVANEADLNTGRGDGSVDWSPDGQSIAIGCRNDAIQLWDASSRRKVADLVGHQTGGAPVLFVGFEPNRKRDVSERHEAWPRLISTCGGELIVWNVATKQPLTRIQPQGNIAKAAWSPDGKWIVTAGYNRLAIFDAATGKELAVNEIGRGFIEGTLNLSANGKTMRLHHSQNLSSWNADTGESTQRVTDYLSGASLASPNDHWLAVYDSQQEKDNLWIVDAETCLQRTSLLGHTGNIVAVNWSPDSKQLASASADKSVRIWNVSDGQQTQQLDHDRAVRTVIWSPDGQQVATCTDDDIIRLWSIGKKNSSPRAFDRLPSPVGFGPYSLNWSPDGKLIAIAPSDAGARVLDIKSGKISEPFMWFTNSIHCVAWSPDGKQLLAGNFWEVGYRAITAKESAVVAGLGAPLFWHPDKRRFATGCWGSYPIQAFDTRKVAKIGTLIPRFGIGAAHWVCIGPDGHFRGSENVESQLVVVAITKDGGQKLYSIVDFSEKYGWKNDPAKARLMKLDEAGGK